MDHVTRSHYKILLPKVEYFDNRVKEILLKYSSTIDRDELYSFALGLSKLEDIDQLPFHPLDVPQDIWELRSHIRGFTSTSIPEEFNNDECFSSSISSIDNNTDLYIFVLEVPQKYAEDKYGVNFEYLDRLFKRL